MQFSRSLVSILALFQTAAALAGPVDINSADAKTLSKELRGIGPARAEAIIKYRTQHGPFKSPDELALVKNIPQKVIDANRADIRTQAGPSSGSEKVRIPAAARAAPAAAASASPAAISSSRWRDSRRMPARITGSGTSPCSIQFTARAAARVMAKLRVGEGKSARAARRKDLGDALQAGDDVPAERVRTGGGDGIAVGYRPRPAEEHGDARHRGQRRQFLRVERGRRLDRAREHDGVGPRALRGVGQFGERHVRAEEHRTEALLVRGEREEQQPDLVVLDRESNTDPSRATSFVETRTLRYLASHARVLSVPTRETIATGPESLAVVRRLREATP